MFDWTTQTEHCILPALRLRPGFERWIDFFQKNSMCLTCPFSLAKSQCWNWLKGSPLPLRTLSKCPQRIPSRMSSSLSNVSGIQVRRKMLWHMETEVVREIVTTCVSLAGCGQKDACEQQKITRAFLLKQEKRRSVRSSSVLSQMSHQSWLTCWMCAQCANEGNVFVDAGLKPDFIIEVFWGYYGRNITSIVAALCGFFFHGIFN